MVSVFVPKEWQSNERRVAATPETVKKLIALGATVHVERGAGDGAFIPDELYRDAGAGLIDDITAAFEQADVIIKVAPLGKNPTLGCDEATLIKPEGIVVGLLNAYEDLQQVQTLAQRNVTSFPMEFIPRISRAQSMDALSSQASIAGYKAVLLSASALPSHFPLLMTAAGTIKPARVIIMGAGVAGLQAIATARRLGANVEVSDIRPEVEEQVKSLGAKFIELPELQSGAGEGGYAKEMGPEFLAKQRAIVAKRVQAADVVITTALIPGRPAPVLITKDMVASMKPGSVIVDLAVAAGGNCELSKLDAEITAHGVRILGYSYLPSTMAKDASQVYARNVLAFVELLISEGSVSLNFEDEILAGTVLSHAGSIRHPRIAELVKGGT